MLAFRRIDAVKPDALAVEMEGAAMAQVCADFGCPLAVVRTVSDRADDTAHVDFGRFVTEVIRATGGNLLVKSGAEGVIGDCLVAEKKRAL